MRSIVHLSDLHFNRVDDSLVAPLVDCIRNLRPDVVAISGDFTQHASPNEFARAQDLLRNLPGNLIVVPGNHDMSFYNPWRRATQRLNLYKQYITSNLQPFYSDAEVAILGLNTARVSHLRNGRIRDWQVDQLEQVMSTVESGAIRVLVTHHPFDLPESYASAELIGSRMLKRILGTVDVMLAGHMHISWAAPTALRYKLAGHSAVFVQAGTALSTRGRGEPNSFQVIYARSQSIVVEQYSAHADKFESVKDTRFVRSKSGWTADTLEVHDSATPEDLRLLRLEQRLASEIPGNSPAIGPAAR